MEVVIAMGLGAVLLAVVATLTVYGARTMVAMGNYVDLDSQSRNAVDTIGREIRDSSAVLSFKTNQLVLTNATAAVIVTLTYHPTDRTLEFEKTGQSPKILLTQCDSWDFWLYDRAPLATNLTFHAATNGLGQLDPAFCKVINMSWNCSRTILGAKLTTESVQTAQIVLRNKVE